MQHRMKEFPMTESSIQQLLGRSKAGRISTIGADGYPYTVAVHFVAADSKIYFHGLNQGEKISNIRVNPKVCFEVDDFISIMIGDASSPCEADAEYESVVIRGDAKVVEDFDLKKSVLKMIVDKYTPTLSALEMPEAGIRGTAVIEIDIKSITGKYHR